ncbi:MAG: 3-phosphoshikimate 1-carboxyvinyltransferase [Candidatus Promineifilaceae bacterium]
MARLHVWKQGTPLVGTVAAPGDKSISHRAVMLAALAEGESLIRHWLPAGDTLATLAAAWALGVEITAQPISPQSWELMVRGRGLYGLQMPAQPVDCANAGTCLRLLAGILCGQPFTSVLDGSAQLRRRPMRRITAPLRQMGAAISDQDGRAPLIIQPAPLHGIRYEMPVASAQVKSAILLAGLYAAGETAVYQPGPARDHTERMLRHMGLELLEMDGWVALPSQTIHLQPLVLDVPADISSAAFVLAAAGVVPHSQVTLTAVGVNPTRTGILDVMAAMGAAVIVTAERAAGAGEPVADLTVSYSQWRGVEIGGDLVVRAIDEFPILAVAATQAAGATVVRDAAELRVKEVDRISVLAGELAKMGAVMEERADGFAIRGPQRLRGARVDSHEDHRLGMALAVAGLAAEGETVVENAACVADSFPGFVETMQGLGGNMRWGE